MSKQLEKLYAKAKETGFAKVNGRRSEYDYGYVYTGELEEKYSIDITLDCKHTNCNILTLKHWGTVILKINLASGVISEFWCQSNSDRDSINCILGLCTNLLYHCHNYPSKCKAVLYHGDKLIATTNY